MIKFYYFDSTAGEMSRPGFPIRDLTGPMRICQVYSDKSRSELVAWTRRHDLPRRFIHRHEGLMSHLDLWGDHFELGGPGIEREAFVKDIAWSDGRRAM